MEKRGIVYRLDGAFAWIAYVRESACGSDCASCKGCESIDMSTRVYNDIDAQVGDIVALIADESRMARLSNVLYLVPFGFFLIGVVIAYVVSLYVSVNAEALAILLGFLLLLISGFVLRRLDYAFGKNQTIYMRIIQRKEAE